MYKMTPIVNIILLLIVICVVYYIIQQQQHQERFVNATKCAILAKIAGDNKSLSDTINKNVSAVIPGVNLLDKGVLNKKLDLDTKRYDYCYVSSFDYSKPANAPACSLILPDDADEIDKSVYSAYSGKMFNRVMNAEIYDSTDTVPKPACVIEIDSLYAEVPDVTSFATAISAFHTKPLMTELKDTNNALKVALMTTKQAEDTASKLDLLLKIEKNDKIEIEQRNIMLTQETVMANAIKTAAQENSVVLVLGDYTNVKTVPKPLTIADRVIIDIPNNEFPIQYQSLASIIIPNGFTVGVSFTNGASPYVDVRSTIKVDSLKDKTVSRIEIKRVI